jgi:beta-N-acetylhexosaminidase
MTAALAAAVAAVALAAGGGSTDARLSADQLVGQRLVVGFAGTEVPDSVRSLVAAGDLAGVVLFSTNFSTPDEAASLVADLRSVPLPPEAREPLLVMVDQEGGEVKRLPGPPDLSAAQMGAAGPATCGRQGDATGAMLRRVGFDTDLAPVLDVAAPGSAMDAEGRSFGADPAVVARCAEAFADGLERHGVTPTAKHFPGLGAATGDTDVGVQRIEASRAHLRRIDEAPYRTFASGGGAGRLVTLSSAVYPTFGDRPASLEPALATEELRDRLGFRGVSMTDALETTAAFGDPAQTAVMAAHAGADLLMFTSDADAATAVKPLRDLLGEPRWRQRFAIAVERVRELRARLAGG